MNCRRGGSAGRLEAGRFEAGRVEAGARDAKVAKVALLTRARGGCPVRIFACAGLARWTNKGFAEPAPRRGVRPPSARPGTGFAKDERSARGAGRIKAGIMTA